MKSSKTHKVYALATISALVVAFLVAGTLASGSISNGLTASAQTLNSTTSGTGSDTASNSSATSGANMTSTNSTSSNATTTASSNTTTSTSAANVTSIMAQRMVGQISSVQLDNTTGKPAWIQSGVWLLRGIKNSTGGQTEQLYARFEMIKPDGTAMHKHLVYAFKMAGQPTTGSDGSTVLNGTATVTMPGGPVKDVPITIKIFNQKLIGMWIGPDKVNNHFGPGPVYGTVTKASLGVMSEMTNSTQS